MTRPTLFVYPLKLYPESRLINSGFYLRALLFLVLFEIRALTISFFAALGQSSVLLRLIELPKAS